MIASAWEGQTVVCLASGPSLCAEDVEAVKGRARVIAVNDAGRLAPWADVLYSSDPQWWKRYYKATPFVFDGPKYAIEKRPKSHRQDYPWPDLEVLRNTGTDGLELDPSGLKTYQNSGGAAINLSVHFGAKRIVLLGYDMALGTNGRKHFCDGPGPSSPYGEFRKRIGTMVGPLRQVGVTVINASRRTALGCFPRATLAEALAAETPISRAELCVGVR